MNKQYVTAQPWELRYSKTKKPFCYDHTNVYVYICKHQAKERLLRGEELDESFVMDVILEKLNSQEIKHYGMYMWNPVFLIGSEVVNSFLYRICIGWATNFKYRLEACTRSNATASGA